MQPDLFVIRFAQHLQDGGARRVLDAGCGTGRNASYLAGLGFQVVALDSAPNKVREAKENTAPNLDIDFLTGRLESLPFSSQAFDALLCTHVLEYLDATQIQTALGEFRRALKKGGLLLLVTAAKEEADLTAAEDLGQNDYLFWQGCVAIQEHLADKAELEGWLQGLAIREMLRLSLAYPRPATVSGSWGVVAVEGKRRKG